MKKILNNFLNSNFYSNLNFFLKKKIIKLFKIYFIKSVYNELPKNNYIIKFTEKYQSFIVENFDSDSYRSKNSFGYLNKLISSINLKNFTFLDMGAGDINTFLELQKNSKIKYLYHDLPAKNEIIKKIKKKYNFDNLDILDDIFKIDFNIDFVFLGSSIGYYENYEKILDFLISKNTRYILFAGTIFFESEKFKNDYYILKQLNVLPDINYVYMFNKLNFEKKFLEQNYKILLTKENDYRKINFNNLKYFCKKITYTDILFEKNN